MSGGFWNYGQHQIDNIIEDLEDTFLHTEQELDAITESNLVALIAELKKCSVHMQRLDWFLSGDDGQETYHKRLKEDLDKLI